MQLLYPVIDNSYVFVGFFFLLSGFVLAYNYADRPAPLVKRDFWRARFARALSRLPALAGHLLRHAPGRVARPLARGLLRRGRPHSAAAAGLEPRARHLLEHRRLDALRRGRPLRHLPLAHPPALAQISRPPDRAAGRHLGARTGPPFALHSAQPGPPRRAGQPLQLRLLAARAQVHAARLRLHLPGRGRPGQAPDCPHARHAPARPGRRCQPPRPGRVLSPRPSPTCPSS